MQNLIFPNEKPAQIIHTNGDVTFFPSIFSIEESDVILLDLMENIEWKQEPIWMFGKKIMQPRLTALYGDPNVAYGYSGIVMNTIPWNETLIFIKSNVLYHQYNHEYLAPRQNLEMQIQMSQLARDKTQYSKPLILQYHFY